MLYERQLKFFFRVLALDESRWVKQALLDHMSTNWTSPYLAYIWKIRSELGIFKARFKAVEWKRITYNYFLSLTNQTLALTPWLKPLDGFVRLPYVCESQWSTIIAEFRLGCEGLGNKQPRSGHARKPLCPVCPTIQQNNGYHLLFECSPLSALRAKTGIATFVTSCAFRSIDSQEAYSLFITGYDYLGKPISLSNFFERAKSMNDMRELWLSKW